MLFIVEVVLKELKEYFRNSWLAIFKIYREIEQETGHFFVHNKYTHKTEGDRHRSLVVQPNFFRPVSKICAAILKSAKNGHEN